MSSIVQFRSSYFSPPTNAAPPSTIPQDPLSSLIQLYCPPDTRPSFELVAALIAELENQLQSLSGTEMTSVQAIEAELETLTAMPSLQVYIEGHQAKIVSLQSSIQAQKATIATLTQRIDAQQGDLVDKISKSLHTNDLKALQNSLPNEYIQQALEVFISGKKRQLITEKEQQRAEAAKRLHGRFYFEQELEKTQMLIVNIQHLIDRLKNECDELNGVISRECSIQAEKQAKRKRINEKLTLVEQTKKDQAQKVRHKEREKAATVVRLTDEKNNYASTLATKQTAFLGLKASIDARLKQQLKSTKETGDDEIGECNRSGQVRLILLQNAVEEIKRSYPRGICFINWDKIRAEATAAAKAQLNHARAELRAEINEIRDRVAKDQAASRHRRDVDLAAENDRYQADIAAFKRRYDASVESHTDSIEKIDQELVTIKQTILSSENETKNLHVDLTSCDYDDATLTRSRRDLKSKQRLQSEFSQTIEQYKKKQLHLKQTIDSSTYVEPVPQDDAITSDEINALSTILKEHKDEKFRHERTLKTYEMHLVKLLQEADTIDVTYAEKQTQIQEQKKALEQKLEQAQASVWKTRELFSELLPAKLLTEDMLLTGYPVKQMHNPIEQVVLSLLQHVQKDYPLAHLQGATVGILPTRCQSLSRAIAEKVGDRPLDAACLQKIILAFHEEFPDHPEKFDVTIFNPKTLEKISNGAQEAAKKILILQIDGQFFTIATPKEVFENNAYSAVQNLVMTLTCSETLLEALAKHTIAKECGSLDNIDSLKTFYQNQESALSGKMGFEAFAKAILLPDAPPGDYTADIAYVLLNKIVRISGLKHALSDTDERSLCQHLAVEYLQAQRNVINKQILILQERQLQKALKDNDFFKKSEAAIAIKEDELAKEQKRDVNELLEIEEKKQALEQLQAKHAHLEESYKLQLEQIHVELGKCKALEKKLEEELSALERDEAASQEAIDKVKGQQAKLVQNIAAWKEKEKNISKQIEEVKTDLNALEHQINDVETERKQAEVLLTYQEEKLSKEKAILSSYKTVFQFVTEIRNRFMENETLFSKRATLRSTIATIKTNPASSAQCAKMLYTALEQIGALDQMQDLALIRKELESPDIDPKLLMQVIDVIEDLVAPPKVLLQTAQMSCLVTGCNLGWQEIHSALHETLDHQLRKQGLKLNANGFLSFDLNEYTGKLSEICPQLLAVIKERVLATFAKRRHDEVLNSRNDTAKSYLQSLKIDRQDVYRAYFTTLEIVAGNSVYLDQDITLPGISLNVFARANIATKKNLHINTSGKNGCEFSSECYKAHDGEAYRLNGVAEGASGDDGEDGFAGQHGGDITLHADNSITHLDTLHCICNGGNGANGQKGGDGDEGRAGLDGKDAEPTDTSGFGRAAFRLALAHIPGQDSRGQFTLNHELPTDGGDAGKPGNGGLAGLAGEVYIQDKDHLLKKLTPQEPSPGIVTIQASPGQVGAKAIDDSVGGKEGLPGRIGAAYRLNKPSFWRKTRKKKGKFDLSFFNKYEKDLTSRGGAKALFGTRAYIDGYRKEFRKQYRISGSSAKAKCIFNEAQYRQNPDRDYKNGAVRGKDNKGTTKQRAQKQDAKQANSSLDATHQKAIKSIAAAAANSIAWQDCSTTCQSVIQKKEACIAHTATAISVSQNVISEKNEVLNRVQQQWQERKRECDKLRSEHAALTSLLTSANDSLHANDQSALRTINKLSHNQSAVSEARRKAEFARIDAQVQSNTEHELFTSYHTLAQALDTQKQELENHIAALADERQARLQEESTKQDLLKLQSDAASSYLASMQKNSEQEHQLLSNTHKKEQSVLTEQFEIEIEVKEAKNEAHCDARISSESILRRSVWEKRANCDAARYKEASQAVFARCISHPLLTDALQEKLEFCLLVANYGSDQDIIDDLSLASIEQRYSHVLANYEWQKYIIYQNEVSLPRLQDICLRYHYKELQLSPLELDLEWFLHHPQKGTRQLLHVLQAYAAELDLIIRGEKGSVLCLCEANADRFIRFFVQEVQKLPKHDFSDELNLAISEFSQRFASYISPDALEEIHALDQIRKNTIVTNGVPVTFSLHQSLLGALKHVGIETRCSSLLQMLQVLSSAAPSKDVRHILQLVCKALWQQPQCEDVLQIYECVAEIASKQKGDLDEVLSELNGILTVRSIELVGKSLNIKKGSHEDQLLKKALYKAISARTNHSAVPVQKQIQRSLLYIKTILREEGTLIDDDYEVLVRRLIAIAERSVQSVPPLDQSKQTLTEIKSLASSFWEYDETLEEKGVQVEQLLENTLMTIARHSVAFDEFYGKYETGIYTKALEHLDRLEQVMTVCRQKASLALAKMFDHFASKEYAACYRQHYLRLLQQESVDIKRFTQCYLKMVEKDPSLAISVAKQAKLDPKIWVRVLQNLHQNYKVELFNLEADRIAKIIDLKELDPFAKENDLQIALSLLSQVPELSEVMQQVPYMIMHHQMKLAMEKVQHVDVIHHHLAKLSMLWQLNTASWDIQRRGKILFDIHLAIAEFEITKDGGRLHKEIASCLKQERAYQLQYVREQAKCDTAETYSEILDTLDPSSFTSDSLSHILTSIYANLVIDIAQYPDNYSPQVLQGLEKALSCFKAKLLGLENVSLSSCEAVILIENELERVYFQPIQEFFKTKLQAVEETEAKLSKIDLEAAKYSAFYTCKDSVENSYRQQLIKLWLSQLIVYGDSVTTNTYCEKALQEKVASASRAYLMKQNLFSTAVDRASGNDVMQKALKKLQKSIQTGSLQAPSLWLEIFEQLPEMLANPDLHPWIDPFLADSTILLDHMHFSEDQHAKIVEIVELFSEVETHTHMSLLSALCGRLQALAFTANQYQFVPELVEHFTDSNLSAREKARLTNLKHKCQEGFHGICKDISADCDTSKLRKPAVEAIYAALVGNCEDIDAVIAEITNDTQPIQELEPQLESSNSHNSLVRERIEKLIKSSPSNVQSLQSFLRHSIHTPQNMLLKEFLKDGYSASSLLTQEEAVFSQYAEQKMLQEHSPNIWLEKLRGCFLKEQNDCLMRPLIPFLDPCGDHHSHLSTLFQEKGERARFNLLFEAVQKLAQSSVREVSTYKRAYKLAESIIQEIFVNLEEKDRALLRQLSQTLEQFVACKESLFIGTAVAQAEHKMAEFLKSMQRVTDEFRESHDLEECRQYITIAVSFLQNNRLKKTAVKFKNKNLIQNLFIAKIKQTIRARFQNDERMDELLCLHTSFKTTAFAGKKGRRVLEVISELLEKDDQATIEEVIVFLRAVSENVLCLNENSIALLKAGSLTLATRKLRAMRLCSYLHLEALHPNNEHIVDLLLRIEKEKGEKRVDECVHSICMQKQISTDLVNSLISGFASGAYPLDDHVIEILINEPQDKWIESIQRYNEELNAKSIGSDGLPSTRNAELLVECMRLDQSGSNAGIGHLLSSNILLELVEDSKKRFDQIYKGLDDDAMKPLIRDAANKFRGLNGAVFKQNLSEMTVENREHLLDLLAAMCAAIKVAHKYLDYGLRDTQLLAVLCFVDGFYTNKGRLANISTGEGKTLITVLVAIARALCNERVDILTSSSVLAMRDADNSKSMFELFGITVSNNCDSICVENEDKRKMRYRDNQVIYGDTSSFQRDYLLSNYMGKDIRPRLAQNLIVDEVDSMFIDNADRTLYISHRIEDLHHLRDLFLLIYYTVQGKDVFHYSDKNVVKVKKFIQDQIANNSINLPQTLKEFVDRRIDVWIRNAYIARDMSPGVQYSIPKSGEKQGVALIMDLYTGVEQMQTQWSNGLHQFIQIKHRCKLSDESLKAIFISNMNFFRQYKGRINGMSGTLGSKAEQELVAKSYEVDFFKLPRFQKKRYAKEPGKICGTQNEWISSIIEDVNRVLPPENPSRAVLVIAPHKNAVQCIHQAVVDHCPHLEKQIRIFDSVLEKMDVTDLNPGDVVIATNLGGRGVDLVCSDEVNDAGGLHVVMVQMADNERVEKQGFGRTSRKGMKGSGKYIVLDPRILRRPLTIARLQQERDEEEAKRLRTIQAEQIPRLDLEDELFKSFSNLQSELADSFKGALGMSEFAELQIQSLRNHWAFWLDQQSGKIQNISKTGKSAVLAEYDAFAEKMRTQLKDAAFGLIQEPGQLLKLGKLYRKNKEYAKALHCYDEIIRLDQKDPIFGFAYYYKAECILGQGSDIARKRNARTALKKAVRSFERTIARMMSSCQIVDALGNREIKSGHGGSVNYFRDSYLNEISILNIHLEAAKTALGSDFIPDIFAKCGAFTADERQKVYEKVEKLLADKIKTHRISKKRVKVRSENGEKELYYNSEKIAFPSALLYAKKDIIEKLEAAMAERVVPKDFFEEFILTEKRFCELMGDKLQVDTVLEKCPDFEKNEKEASLGMSLWNNDVRIKEYIVSLNAAITEKELKSQLTQTFKLDAAQVDALIAKCIEHKILKSATGYKLSCDTQKRVTEAVSKIQIKSTLGTDFVKQLHLEEMRIFSGHVARLQNELVQPKSDGFTKEDLGLDEGRFSVLRSLLLAHGFLEKDFVSLLSIQPDKPFFSHSINTAITALAQGKTLSASDLQLAESLQNRAQKILSIFVDCNAIKNPKIKFGLQKSPGDELDEIKDRIENNIKDLLPDVDLSDGDEKDKYVKYVSNAIEATIGQIKSFKKIKLSSQNLQECFSAGKFPPEVMEYAVRCCDDVMALKEDKGWWSWGAFTCFLIGVVQVVAGAILSVTPLSFLGTILINEGLSDMIFAVSSMMNGTFSWKAYGDHKWRSLITSVASAGIGAAVNGSFQVVNSWAMVDWTQLGIAMKTQIVSCLVQTATTTAVNYTLGQVVSGLSSVIISEFRKSFRSSVANNAEFIRKKQSLEAMFSKIYAAFSAEDARTIIDFEIASLNLEKKISDKFFTKALKVGKFLQQGLAKFTNNAAKGSLAETIKEIASVVSALMKVVSMVKSLEEMGSATAGLLGDLEQKLEAAYQRRKSSVVTSQSVTSVSQACSTHLNGVTDSILEQILAFMQAHLVSEPVQYGYEIALSNAVQECNKKLTEQLVALGTHIEGENKQGEKVDATIDRDADKKEQQDEASSDEKIWRLDHIADSKRVVRSPAGEFLVEELQSEQYKGEDAAYVVEHNGVHYLADRDYDEEISAIQEGKDQSVFAAHVVAKDLNVPLRFSEQADACDANQESQVAIFMDEGRCVPQVRNKDGAWESIESCYSHAKGTLLQAGAFCKEYMNQIAHGASPETAQKNAEFKMAHGESLNGYCEELGYSARANTLLKRAFYCHMKSDKPFDSRGIPESKLMKDAAVGTFSSFGKKLFISHLKGNPIGDGLLSKLGPLSGMGAGYMAAKFMNKVEESSWFDATYEMGSSYLESTALKHTAKWVARGLGMRSVAAPFIIGAVVKYTLTPQIIVDDKAEMTHRDLLLHPMDVISPFESRLPKLYPQYPVFESAARF